MENRRSSAEIAYPFAPNTEVLLAYAQGVKDILLVVSGYPMDPDSGEDHGYRDEYAYLAAVIADVSGNVYVFMAVSPDGARVFAFDVPRGLGIIRAANFASAQDAHIIVDSSRMYDTPGTHTLPGILEVEPAQIVWRLTEIRSITLVDECRHHDPSKRVNMPDDRIKLGLLADRPAVNTLKLRNGWNCEVSYDEDSSTLMLDGGPGLGRGLPATIYWDSSPPDFATGVLSVNGIAGSGGTPTVNNVNIKPGPSVILTQTAEVPGPTPASPSLTFTVKAETDV